MPEDPITPPAAPVAPATDPANIPPAPEDPTEPTADPPEASDSSEVIAMRAALKKANKEAETTRRRLKEFEERDLSELEKAQRSATESAARLAEYESTNLRQKVALDKGVPAALVGRLQGTTEEEVAADADALLALLNVPRTPAPDPGQGARTPPSDAEAEFARYASAMKLPTPRKAV